jgi:hypothetical protein
MNKKIPLFLLGVVLVAGIVTAGYVVITSTVNVSVKEAFTNEYAVSIDNNGIDCSAVINWLPLESAIELGELYPLDTRDICIKVSNEAPNGLDYATIVGDELDLVATVGLTSGGLQVASLGSSIDEIVITMNDDAPVGEYGLSVEVNRG